MSAASTQTSDLVKIGAGLVVGAAVARLVWKLASGGSPKRATQPSYYGTNGARPGGGSPTANSASRPKSDVYIYFGSQSGTAETFAHELEEEAAQHDIKATVIDLEEFESEEFVTQKVVIFVVATYGEGDPTDNSVEFFKWLEGAERETNEVEGMKFCVFGLGNRQYVNFCSCGRTCDSRLEALGGSRVVAPGEGDDDQNIEEDFEQWKESGLWPALRTATGKGVEADHERNSRASKQDVMAGLQLKAEVASEPRSLPVDPLVQVGGADVLGKWYFQSHQAQVTTEYELRQQTDLAAGKTTKHLDVDVKSIPSLDWRTADNLEVLPTNPSDVVEWWANRLGCTDSLDSSLGFVRAEGVERPVKKPFPTPCTVQEALSHYCDLCQPPSKMHLRKFAVFLEDEEERNVFEGLLEDRHVLQWLTGDGVRLSFRELFELFLSSAQIDLGTFLQLCPRQRSRPYTIASSSREDKHTIGVCVGVVAEELKPLNAIIEELNTKGHVPLHADAALASAGAAASQSRSFRGVCSSMLCTQTKVGDRLHIQAKPSTFRLPRKSTAPIIMVGAGTGIAPFRAFAREFQCENTTRPKTMLLFGCQRSDTDFLYKDELEEAVNKKTLRRLVTAFSREQQDKVYVQHKVRDNAAEIAEWVKEGGYVYVCGATAMGASIRQEIGAALGSPDYVSRMITEGRFIEELW